MLSKTLAPLLLMASLSAATYDDNYRVTDLQNPIEKNFNTFMDGDFEQIIRFEAILMNGENFDDRIDAIAQKVKELQDASKDIKLTIIGYKSRATDDENEESIDSGIYANAIENWFRDEESTQSALEKSEEYASDIKERVVDAGVDEKIITLEYRGGEDSAYTDATSEGKELSNRVMVSIYVTSAQDIDSDKDGVFDKDDKCPATPRGEKVDAKGCMIDSDKDGVLDYKDECPDTPIGVSVDTKGCPLDSDKDGVVDYKDKCAETPAGLKVDFNGCPISSKLHLNFKPASDKIATSSVKIIKDFARFMNENKMYKAEIIGHTDSVGRTGYNMALSQKRAAIVKKALVAEGVDASRLTTSGRGELEPLTTNRTEEGRKTNRRTEVRLSY